MKIAFLFVFMGLMTANAEANTFKCQGNLVRNNGSTLSAKVDFLFRLYAINGKILMRGLVGSFKLMDTTVQYSIDSNANDRAYQPVKYKNSIRFRDINSSNPTESSALFGDLILERGKTRSGEIKAHYVFKGDQVGGTVDLLCSEEIN